MATNTNDPDLGHQITITDLPMSFKVKYIGTEVAQGLWGIKYTRKPIDLLVEAAKTFSPNKLLQYCNLTVSISGVAVDLITPENNSTYQKPITQHHPISTISYGVQDLVYTRIFAMIVVNDNDDVHSLHVHAFVCDNRSTARKITFALAAAFQNYSKFVKETGDRPNESIERARQKFAIDLRSPEELQDSLERETDV